MVSGHLDSIEGNFVQLHFGHSDMAECSGECSPIELCRFVYICHGHSAFGPAITICCDKSS